MLGLKYNPFKSLTVLGTVVAVGTGILVPHFDPAALNPTAQVVLTAAGILTAAVGGRNAVAKAIAQILTDLANKR